MKTADRKLMIVRLVVGHAYLLHLQHWVSLTDCSAQGERGGVAMLFSGQCLECKTFKLGSGGAVMMAG